MNSGLEKTGWALMEISSVHYSVGFNNSGFLFF